MKCWLYIVGFLFCFLSMDVEDRESSLLATDLYQLNESKDSYRQDLLQPASIALPAVSNQQHGKDFGHFEPACEYNFRRTIACYAIFCRWYGGFGWRRTIYQLCRLII